jgi:hypothetical protein
MNYLELSGKQLPCQFIKKPDSLFEAFEQLFSAFECFRLGDEDVTGGNAGDEDFFQYCPLELLEDFENAMQHARRHSDMINRFCDEIDKGRRPSMKVGIRLISLVDRGKKPTKGMVTEWDDWVSELRDYVKFFEESLLIDYLYSEEGYRDRGETKPVQQSNATPRIELEFIPTNAMSPVAQKSNELSQAEQENDRRNHTVNSAQRKTSDQAATESSRKKPGTGEVLLKAHLLQHHQYKGGIPPKIENLKAVACSTELAQLHDIAVGTVSIFFKRWFKSRKRYDKACEREDFGIIAFALQLMNGDVRPPELRHSLQEEARSLTAADE